MINVPVKFVLNFWPKRSWSDEFGDPAYPFAILKSLPNIPNWVLNPEQKNIRKSAELKILNVFDLVKIYTDGF